MTAREALDRVLKAAEQPSAHILIVVMHRVVETEIRDQILARVPGAEFRAASHGILFKTGSWVTFLIARSARPDSLAGNQFALSWAHDLGDLIDSACTGWLANLRVVTRAGDAPAVLISEDPTPRRP